MARNTKLILLLLLTGALVSLVLLSASLSNLKLHTGTPFPGSTTSNDSQPVMPLSPATVYSVPVLRGIVALLLLIGMFYLPARLISRANLKLISQAFLVLAALIMLAYILPEITPVQPAYNPDESLVLTEVPSREYLVTPLGEPPQVLIWFVITGLGLGMGSLIFILVKRQLNPSKIEAAMLHQAEGAMGALQAGMDLKNVIVRCYLQMTHAIQEEQGLERTDSMTAREFENWLAQKGFPSVPVRQLTSLFEKVRYSKQSTSSDDEKMAVDSLHEIIRFCRTGKA